MTHSRCPAFDVQTFFATTQQVDLVLANPPFSGDRGNVTEVEVWGKRLKCGYAAAHTLIVLATFSPKELVGIFPESFFHSQRDSLALNIIKGLYSVRILKRLGNKSFKRSNASVCVVRMSKLLPQSRLGDVNHEPFKHLGSELASLRIVRGSLPMYRVKEYRCLGGVPLIHSTDILELNLSFTVKPRRRGLIRGCVVLVPRVGRPSLKHIAAHEFDTTMQLSDCVVGLCFDASREALLTVQLLRENFDSFRDCWCGTGAPYTTLTKLKDFLANIGIKSVVSANTCEDSFEL